MKICAPFAISSLIFCSAFSAAPQTYSAKVGPFGPSGEIVIARPLLSWEFASKEGLAVTGQVSINGKSFPASYNATSQRLEFTPTDPLAAGDYQVEMRATLGGKATYKQPWSFKVASNAFDSLPAVSDDQKLVVTMINKLRETMKLPPATSNDFLNAAANLHAQYLDKNKTTGHEEKVGQPGFLDVTHVARLSKLGFGEPCFELVMDDEKSVDEAVASLFNTCYHRMPFMQTGDVSVGAAWTDGHLVVLFSYGDADSVVVSPADQAKDVPLNVKFKEDPDPLRLYPGAKPPIGYPIVVNVVQQGGSGFAEVNATLKSGGVDVPFFLSSPGNDDELVSSIVLIPKKPLMPNTVYQVKVWGKNASGEDFAREWSFTTAAK
jgi:uncharacterized protein YkwD